MALTERQMSSFRKRIAKELEQDYQRKARERIKQLRDNVRRARGQRKVRRVQARSICRAARTNARERAKAIRARHLELARAEILALRTAATSTCSVSAQRARERALESVRRAGLALDAERTYQATIKRAAAKPKLARADVVRAARERAAESNSTVEGNLPRELIPVWRKRASLTKSTERATRTEVFLQWVHDHPADVERIMLADIDQQVEKWVREEREHSRRSPASRAQLQDAVPF